MKKLFISCPMRGRTEEAIRTSMEKMHKAAEALVGEPLEVIPSYIEDKPPKDSKEAIWYLGESIKMLSLADYFVYTTSCGLYPGCSIERAVADSYGIKAISVDSAYILDDVFKTEEEKA